MTVQTPSVGADGEQPTTNIINSITPELEEIKSKDRKDRLILLGHKLNQESSKNFLPTVNLDELFESVYRSKPAIVENLIYPGTYILAGAPKVGKSLSTKQQVSATHSSVIIISPT